MGSSLSRFERAFGNQLPEGSATSGSRTSAALATATVSDNAACIKLEEYQTSKAALEQGSSYASSDSRLTYLLKECEERIAAGEQEET